MGIFGKKNSNNKALQSIDWPEFADSDMPSPIILKNGDAVTGQIGLVYSNKDTENIIKSKAANKKEEKAPKVNDGLWLMDIAQSHHYTVWLEGMKMSKLKVPTSPLGSEKGFLPVRSMNLRYTSYENMSIPVAIFGDFPLLNKKRVSTIDLTCYDYDNHALEYELRQWEARCFPQGRFVAYMDEIAREFVYSGYGVDGRNTLTYRVFVIPAGNVTVSRDYSANEAKMISFSLVVVGDGQTCAIGKGKEPGEIVEDHGGAGDGRLPKGDFATLYVSGYGQFNKKTQRFEM
jgi:hypothetical protein